MTVRGPRALIVGVVGAVGVLLSTLPLTAGAALPKPASAEIVNFTSIGGVGIGTTRARVFNLWGPAVNSGGSNGCYNPDAPGYPDEVCVWQIEGTGDIPPEGGYVEFVGNKVCEVYIQAGYTAGDWVLHTTKLRRQKWQTEGGVGLESPKGAAIGAFPGTQASGFIIQGTRAGVLQQIYLQSTGPDKNKVQRIRLVKNATACFRN
jgi:hypothetical protein